MNRRIFSIYVLGFVLFLAVIFTTTQIRQAHAQSGATPTLTSVPGADFSGTPLAGSTPLTVQFTALNSSVISTCTWTFGDGTSQTFNTPAGQTVHLCPSVSHVYTTTGFFTVSLRVTKATSGATNTMTKPNYIQVANPGESTATLTRTPIPCGAIIVVTSTPSPTFTPTPRVATATATSCGPIFITATPNGTVTSGPDLVISSITPTISGPACAVVRSNNVLVTNNGNVAAGTFMVSYSAGGVVAPAQTVNGLAAGQSITLSFPDATGAGMTITATADSTGVISETNEANNSLTVGPFPVPTRAPTCTPGGPTFTPTVTPTLTRTLTRTPTGPACITATPENMLVGAVTSPTSAMTQVITVSVNHGTSVTVTSEAGTFTSNTPVNGVFSVTVTLVANSTNHLQIQATINAANLCAPYVLTRTATIIQTSGGITNTPTRTPTATVMTPDPTPAFIEGCSPVTSTITAPFTFDGAGTFCWQSSNLGTFINSWNTTSVTLNGINVTNVWMGSGSYPAKISGFWYVGYSSTVAWGHFEAK